MMSLVVVEVEVVVVVAMMPARPVLGLPRW
jgi:hypothetical protein